MSASLVDAEGQVVRLGDRLLLGPETTHSWQFDGDANFVPDVWMDSCAKRVVTDLIRQARGIAAALAAGIILN